RRLADPLLAVSGGPVPPRLEAQYAPADQPVEDPRQPAAQPRGSVAGSAGRRGLDGAARAALVLDPPGHHGARLAAAADRGAPADRAAPIAVGPGLPFEPAPRHADFAGANLPRRNVPGVSRLRLASRHRGHARPAGGHEEGAPRLGNGGGEAL